MNTNSVVLAPRGLFSYAIPTRPTCVRRFQDSRPLLATRRTLILPFDGNVLSPSIRRFSRATRFRLTLLVRTLRDAHDDR